MASKNQRKIAGNTDKTIRNISFIFYGRGNEKTPTILEDSIKQLKKELKDHSEFYYLKNSQYSLTSDLITGIEIKNGSLPFYKEDNDHVIFLPVDRLAKNINLNNFFSLKKENYPVREAFSRLFFQDKTLNPPIVLVLGRDIAKYLSGLVFSKKKSFKNQIEWYLNRLNAQQSDILLKDEDPFSYKEIGFPENLPDFFAKRSLYWNFKLALKEQKEGTGFKPHREKPIWRMVFFITAVFILFLLPVLSYNAAISGDEEKHHLHAVKVYDYFKTNGADTLAINDPKHKLNYYGQSFDLFAYLFIKSFNIEKIYETRHVLNGIAGALAIIATGILIRYLAGSFAGFITLIFMFFFPRFMGHAMNNPLDVPFALGYIFSIYQMILFR